MLAQRPKITEYNGQKVSYLQEKYNGMFVQIERNWINDSNTLKVYTRTKGTDLWPQIRKTHLADICLSLPKQTSIFAELYWDGPATAIKTKLNEGGDELKLCAFAAPWLNGEDLSNEDLDSIMGMLHRLGWETPQGHITICSTHSLSIEEVKHLKLQAIQRNIEGYVAKKSHMTGWYKIKPVKTIDCVVLSTNKSFAATTFGEVRSLNVGVYKNGLLTKIAQVGTGFSVEERALLKSVSPLGRVCEIEYQDFAQQGNLQFPRFLKWRDDKPAKECKL